MVLNSIHLMSYSYLNDSFRVSCFLAIEPLIADQLTGVMLETRWTSERILLDVDRQIVAVSRGLMRSHV